MSETLDQPEVKLETMIMTDVTVLSSRLSWALAVSILSHTVDRLRLQTRVDRFSSTDRAANMPPALATLSARVQTRYIH